MSLGDLSARILRPLVSSRTAETPGSVVGVGRNAAIGLLVWALVTVATVGGFTSLGEIEALFLLAPLVLVPLGFEVQRFVSTAVFPPGRLAQSVLPIGAAMATVSYWLPAGRTAAWLAAGWALVCALAAIDGLRRLARGGYRSAAGICVGASFLYLFVGSVWLVLSRRGAAPFQYSERTVLLAAVHFHFTGFALPIIAAATDRVRHAPETSSGGLRMFPFVAAGVLLGPALLAAGNIRRVPALKLVGALLLVAASIGLAVLLALVVRCVASKPARTLLAASALALLAGMVLVAIYAFAEFLGRNWLSVGEMARWHGVLNALGFALCGLVGWTLEIHHRPGRGATV